MKKIENVEGHPKEGAGLNGEVWTGDIQPEMEKKGMVNQVSVEETFLQTVAWVNPPATCFQRPA